MLDDWALSVVVPIFKGKGDAMSCMAFRGEKLLSRACNEDNKKGAREEIAAYGESGQDAIWLYAKQRNDKCSVILRRLQEEYLDKEKKLYMCFVDLEKAFDRVPRKVLVWAMRKKLIPVMSLYEDSIKFTILCLLGIVLFKINVLIGFCKPFAQPCTQVP